MNYKNIYDSLIKNALARGRVNGYRERHHIIPRSMGGSDEKNNLVELTAREHFIAHMCLALIYSGTQWLSVQRMKGGNKRYFNGRLYEIARVNGAIAISNALKGKPNPKVSIARKGIVFSSAHRKAISDSNKGKKKPKLSIAQLGVTKSESHRQAISIAQKGRSNYWLKGKPWSEARRQAQQRSRFDRDCKKLNTLIDSVFQA